jgi:hypothetical protein
MSGIVGAAGGGGASAVEPIVEEAPPATGEPPVAEAEQAAAVTDLADPAPLQRDAERVAAGALGFERVGGDLFLDGITADDPQQGVIGDCYLIASMAALAQRAPERIRDLIRDNGDGTVTVRFSDVSKEGTTPREVTVDLEMLVRREADGSIRQVYASSQDRDVHGNPELWPAIIEKAYAQLRGSFQEIGATGGFAFDALNALTGIPSESDPVGGRVDAGDMETAHKISALFKGMVTPESMLETMAKKRAEHGEGAWTWLKEGAARGMPMVASTYTEPDLLEAGLLPMHAYTVLGVEERDGQRFVQLRNPAPYLKEMDDPALAAEMRERPDLAALADMYSSQGVSPKDLRYGAFEIPFEEFRRCFATASRTPLPPA